MRRLRSAIITLLLALLFAIPLLAKGGDGSGGGKGGGRRVRSADGQHVPGYLRVTGKKATDASQGATTAPRATPSKKTPTRPGRQADTHTGAGTLYVVDGSDGTISTLYSVDPTTGVGTVIGSVGFSLTAIDIDPTTGTMYGVTTKFGAAPNSLVTIDTTTGAGTLVGSLGLPVATKPSGSTTTPSMPDITFDASGVLYGWVVRGNIYDLYTINKTTGAAAKVGESDVHGTRGGGLAVGGGALYGTVVATRGSSARGPMATIDRVTGQILTPAKLDPSFTTDRHGKFYFDLTAMATNAAGVVYGLTKSYSNAGPIDTSKLVTIDPATGAMTLVGDTGVLGLDALDFNKTTGTLYAAQGVCGQVGSDDFFTLNPATGVATPVGDMGGYSLTGLAVHPTTQVVYGVTDFCSTNPAHLVTVNPANGTVTDLGPLNIPSESTSSPGNTVTLTDLEFSPTGTLYGWSSRGGYDLHTLNLTSGAATKVSENPIHFARGALAYSSGVLLFAGYGARGVLLRLDPASGQFIDPVLDTPSDGGRTGLPLQISAMVASDDGTMFATVRDSGDDHIAMINPATGDVTDIGPVTDGGFPVNGLEGIAYSAAELVGLGGADVYGTKTATGNFQPGGTVIYTIVLTNEGTLAQGDNPGPEFSDTLPAGLTLVDATASSGTVTEDPLTNTVTWNGSIAVDGTVTITITATINEDTAGQTIANQGTIFYDANGDNINESQRLTDNPNDPTGIDDPTHIQIGPAAGIPTINELGLAALALMLAVAGIVLMRMRS